MQDKNTSLGYCGKHCDTCPNYRNPDNPGLASQTPCEGCKSDKCICPTCNMKFCAEKRGVVFCQVCKHFPCSYYSNCDIKTLSSLYEMKEKIIKLH